MGCSCSSPLAELGVTSPISRGEVVSFFYTPWNATYISIIALNHSLLNYFSCIFFLKFTYFERQRERGKEREKPKKVPRSALSTGPDVGLDPTNHEIMTWAKIKNQMLNWLSHPGAPNYLCFWLLSWTVTSLRARFGLSLSGITQYPVPDAERVPCTCLL